MNNDTMKKYFTKMCRGFIILRNRVKNKNKNICIISSNCIGGVVYNELGMKFTSPTINLYFEPEDFLKFVENIQFYLNEELIFENNLNYNFPVAKLNDIHIYFMHYNTKEEAVKKWSARKKRIDLNNIYIVMTDKGIKDKSLFERFEKLPYKNKILFTHNKMNNFNSTYYIPGFENQNELGNIIEYKNIFGQRYYDKFDFIKWFNYESKS